MRKNIDMKLQYKQFWVTNHVRVGSTVRETHVEVDVSSRVKSSVFRVIGHDEFVCTFAVLFSTYCLKAIYFTR